VFQNTPVKTIVMNIRRIKETCIYVSNLEQTKAFYHDTLGLPLIALVKERHVFFRAGGSVLLCFLAAQTRQDQIMPPHGAHGTIHFAFEVSHNDYLPTLQLVRDAGIIILHEHRWKETHQSFYFHDPDQNLVEVIEEGVWDES
jgi:catechol 2,3-dioxygenase-like lactoylglutathione lyase family enzyme